MIKILKLRMSESKLQRLCLVFDERVRDKISLIEYQNTLEAYKLNGEDHFISEKGSKAPYVSYETVALERLTEILRGTKTDPMSLFDSCDKDGSGDISIDELKELIQRLNDNM